MPNLTKIQRQKEREIFRAFMDSIASVKDQAVIAELARLIDAGDIEGIVTLLQLDVATFRPLEASIASAYETGGITGAEQIGRIPTESGTLVARFDIRSPMAEAYLANLSSTQIAEIADETKKVVRSVLTSAMSQGQGPLSTALDLVGRIDPVTRKRTGGFIGLTDQQASWAVNARRELETLDPNYLTRQLRDKRLDAAFAKAVRDGKPMKAAQIDAAVSRLQARTLRYRGENIARTESLQALSEGQAAAINQALETGEVEEEFTRKHWDATGDGRTRTEHLNVELTYPDGLPVDQPFNVGGELMQRPRQSGASAANVINCRCKLRYRVNFAGQASRDIRGFG